MDFLTDPTVIFFVANVLYLASYLVTSMMWLRILAITASISTFPYYFFQDEPLWSALAWQACFLIVNAVNLVILLLSMRPPKFSAFERVAYQLKFESLKPYEVAPIFKHARRLALEEGEQLLVDGHVSESLFLIVRGNCRVVKNGKHITTLKAGDFIGEISLISGERISADVFAAGQTEIMYWKHNVLDPMLEKHSLQYSYLRSMCSIDIAVKLRKLTETSSNHLAWEGTECPSSDCVSAGRVTGSG